ncbi:troponin T, skeletal muscle-like [Chenopodium quinoa]|uniref:troponin T, skeletal muscle-like n=1 Tax=Chenopodium quinoa TaxID=63459 RepID=UPI000B78E2BF|nr:troponin T, skeletal muscle-like [Chenopodium quinoa]
MVETVHRMEAVLKDIDDSDDDDAPVKKKQVCVGESSKDMGGDGNGSNTLTGDVKCGECDMDISDEEDHTVVVQVEEKPLVVEEPLVVGEPPVVEEPPMVEEPEPAVEDEEEQEDEVEEEEEQMEPEQEEKLEEGFMVEAEDGEDVGGHSSSGSDGGDEFGPDDGVYGASDSSIDSDAYNRSPNNFNRIC